MKGGFFWCKQRLLRLLLRKKNMDTTVFFIIRIRISKKSIFIINIYRSNNIIIEVLKFLFFIKIPFFSCSGQP